MATSYQGGAGGKIRRKPLRNTQSTPYDRPPATALRQNPSWVSKMIVEPASKLVTAGAHLFFSSLFRKRLTHTPPPPPEASQEARVTFQETVQLSHVGVQRPTLGVRGKETMTNENGGLSEIELILKQKTFTRSEFDRLTELLQSRTVESSTADKERTTDLRIPEAVSGPQRHASFERSSFQEIGNDNNRSHERVQTDVVSPKVHEEDLATPVELAKAYMGKKSLTVSPSLPGLRSQSVREDSFVLCNSPFAPHLPVMSLAQKPSTHGGVENGFSTPRSRGRSSIYSMARTPYSRNNPTTSHKGTGSIYDGYGGGRPSASPSTGFTRELVSRSVSQDMARKRRCSLLENEIGSAGPIRRLRQKINLSTPINTSFPIARTPFSNLRTGIATNGTLDPSSFKTFQIDKSNENVPGTSYTPVPSQSKETARKILEQLEKFTPKEKQDKVVAPSENTPSQSNDKVKENGRNSSNVFNGSLPPAETGKGTILVKDTVPPFSFSDSVKKQGVNQSSQKKWGFQMSAQEDLLELDASTKYDEQMDSKSVSVAEDKAPVSELKAPIVPFEFGKSTDLGTNDGAKVVEKRSGVVFSSVTPDASTSLQQVISVSQATISTNNFTNKELKAPPPLFSSGSKNDDKVPSFVNGSLGLKLTAPTVVKPDTTNSLAVNPSNATEKVLKLAESVNSVVENTQNPGNTVEKQEKSFTFGWNSSFSSLSNGSLNSTTSSIFSPPVPVVPAFNLENQTPSSFTNLPFSATNSTAVSTEATQSASATSSLLLAPVFKFGLTPNSTLSTSTTPLFVAPPTYSTVSTTFKETSVGNLSSINPPFSAMSPPLAGTGSSIFGFSAGSTSLSTAASTPSVSLLTSISSAQNTSSSNFAFGNNNSSSSSSLFSSLTPVSSPFGSSISAPSPTVFSLSAQTPASGLSTAATSLLVSPLCFTSAAKTEDYTGSPTCSPGKNGNHGDQNTMVEDSMAEDMVQVASTHAPTPTPSFPFFGEPPVSNPSPTSFMFGSTVPATSTGVIAFQFGGQQSQASVQNPNPFGQQSQPGLQNSIPFGQPSVQNPNPFGQQNQPGVQNPNSFGQQNPNPNPFAQQSQPGVQNSNLFDPSGSQDFGGARGSFSLGSGGGERSGRRIVKVKRKNGRK